MLPSNPHAKQGALRGIKGRLDAWWDGSAAGPGARAPRAILHCLGSAASKFMLSPSTPSTRQALDAVDAIVPLRLPTQS